MSSKVLKTKKLDEVAVNIHQFPGAEHFSHLVALGTGGSRPERGSGERPAARGNAPRVMVTISEEDIDDRERNAYQIGASEAEVRMQQALDDQQKMYEQKIAQKEQFYSQKMAQIEQNAALQIGRLEQELQQGRQQYRQLEQQAVMSIQQSVTELGRYQKKVAEESERQIVRLSLEIAKKIVHREVQVDGSILVTMVKFALEYVADARKVRIHVHPEDLSLIRTTPEWDPLERGGLPMEWIGDPSMERGGFLVESDMGMIDGRLSRQFQEIERNFFSNPS